MVVLCSMLRYMQSHRKEALRPNVSPLVKQIIPIIQILIITTIIPDVAPSLDSPKLFGSNHQRGEEHELKFVRPELSFFRQKVRMEDRSESTTVNDINIPTITLSPKPIQHASFPSSIDSIQGLFHKLTAVGTVKVEMPASNIPHSMSLCNMCQYAGPNNSDIKYNKLSYRNDAFKILKLPYFSNINELSAPSTQPNCEAAFCAYTKQTSMRDVLKLISEKAYIINSGDSNRIMHSICNILCMRSNKSSSVRKLSDLRRIKRQDLDDVVIESIDTDSKTSATSSSPGDNQLLSSEITHFTTSEAEVVTESVEFPEWSSNVHSHEYAQRKVSPAFEKRTGNESVVYVHGLFETSGGECRKQPEAGIFELKSAQLAIKHINERDIIPGYKMDMYVNDTKCDSGVAVDSFFYSLYLQPTMTLMLGTGSSEVTERLARVVSRWNIVQVSYGANSPALSDRENFPFFFRTVSPDSSHNPALIAFIQHYGWDTVATLHEQGDIHSLPMNKLVTELEQANISVSLTKGVSIKDYKEHLQELKAQDCRIVIGSFSLSLVRKIFCHVYRLEMFGAEYAWILQGELKETWWTDAHDTECTSSELAKAASGAIVVGSYYMLEGNVSSLSGITLHDLLKDIGFQVTDPRDSGFVSQAYDAVWAMALALRQAELSWQKDVRNATLKDFTYSNYEMAEEIAGFLGKLKFMGISGPVSFHNSDRLGITSFHQNQGKSNEFSLACLHYPYSDELNFKCDGCVGIVWQSDRVPVARRIIRLRIAVLDRRVLICITSLALFGVILALIFLSFNLYYRKFRFIKLSSPNLNNFVVVGCILVYVAMILLGMDYSTLISDSHFGFVCSARAFLLSGGFSLAFGCMFIKTYRVYHIFIRSNTGIVKSKLLHDKQLLGMVGVLVLVDCFIVTLWVTLDPMERQLINLTMQVNPSERNVVYLYQREQCYSVHMAKWLGTLYIYKGLLLVVGCYMAWETRHVKIPALNDSQYIGMSVYNVVITSVIVVALANVIPVERYTLTFVLVSALIFVSTSMTLCLLFLPKIHTILKDADDCGAVVATPGVKVECKTRRFAIDEPNECIYRAEVLNRALKRELHELEEEIARISKKVGIIPPDMQKMRSRNSEFNEQEDEESDDDLPPWVADYKRYPADEASDGIWYTQKHDRPGACFSALSAMQPLLMSAVDYANAERQEREVSNPVNQNNKSRESPSQNKKSGRSIRCSLPTMALFECKQKMTTLAAEPVHISISERTLNLMSDSAKPLISRVTNWSLSKLSISQKDDFFGTKIKSKQYSKSASRLQSEYNNNNNNRIDPLFCTPPSGSLFKMSSNDECQSELSVNTTSCGSDWNTAPLYSSSFVTATENGGSSSNNNTLVTPSETPDLQSLPRDSLTDSNQSSNSYYSNGDSTSSDGKGENRLNNGNGSRSRAGASMSHSDRRPSNDGTSDDQSDSTNANNIWEFDERTACQTNLSYKDADATPTTDYPEPFDISGPQSFVNMDPDVDKDVPDGILIPSTRSNSINTIRPTVIITYDLVPLDVHDNSESSDSCSLIDCSETMERISDDDQVSQDITLTNISMYTDGCAKSDPSPGINESSDSSKTRGSNETLTTGSVSLSGQDFADQGIEWQRNDPNENFAAPSPSTTGSINFSSASTSGALTDQKHVGVPHSTESSAADELGNNTLGDSANNNPANPDNSQMQYNNIRRQIFELERELILLELDRSESVDL